MNMVCPEQGVVKRGITVREWLPVMKNGNNWVIASNERQILGWQMHAIGHYGLFWLSHLEEAEFLDTSQALKLLLLSLCVFYLLTPHDLLEGLELSFEDCRSTGTTEESLWWLNPQYLKCLFLSVNYINFKIFTYTHTHEYFRQI